MTVIGSNISWCNSTWNLFVGCHKVSAGCDNCYAEELVNRSYRTFGQKFDQVRLRLERLAHVRRFRPLETDHGWVPHLVFVNSMSDFWHAEVPDDVLHQVLDVMERHPTIVFQILTKRPIRARKILTERYGGKGIPKHIWIGVSAEDNRVARRLDIMRKLKERCGDGTFFVSVEPIVEETNHLNFEGIDWAITGGESGPRARVMQRHWLMAAIENALSEKVPLWHKQNGTVASHPNIDRVPAKLTKSAEQFRWLRDNGWELIAAEKGGATVDRKTYRQFPRAYSEIGAAMTPEGLF